MAGCAIGPLSSCRARSIFAGARDIGVVGGARRLECYAINGGVSDINFVTATPSLSEGPPPNVGV